MDGSYNKDDRSICVYRKSLVKNNNPRGHPYSRSSSWGFNSPSNGPNFIPQIYDQSDVNT